MSEARRSETGKGGDERDRRARRKRERRRELYKRNAQQTETTTTAARLPGGERVGEPGRCRCRTVPRSRRRTGDRRSGRARAALLCVDERVQHCCTHHLSKLNFRSP